MMAVGAMQAIQLAGKSVPEDYSIVGFDGIEVGQIISPKLTTIKQDTEKMGQIAASEILRMIEKKRRSNSGRSIVVDGQLLEGGTVKKI